MHLLSLWACGCSLFCLFHKLHWLQNFPCSIGLRISQLHIFSFCAGSKSEKFREACAEHHLQKGQGVTGRAFALRNACFCADITQFCKTEYPLVHYARMFGLTSCFAICLRSSHTGDDDYVLEFFLPPSITDIRDQQNLLDSLLATMKPHFRSLRNASGKELDLEWRSMEIFTASRDGKRELSPMSIPILGSAISSLSSSLRNGKMVHHGKEEQQVAGGYNSLNGGGEINCKIGAQNVDTSETKKPGKKPEKKRGKAEKTISLEVLQQYFSGSLKDAAKSLGVCPTTMKRICRQHGISRWPSRKINKVNRSLSKLKRVIESVQGAEGTFTLTSLASSSVPADVNTVSWQARMNGLSPQDSPGSKLLELHDDKNEFLADKASALEHVDDSNQIINGRVSGNEGSHGSKALSGSREESNGTPTSHPSFHGSPPPVNQSSPTNNMVVSPTEDQYIEMEGPMKFPCQPTGEINLAAVFSTPDVFVSSQAPEPFNRMPIEDVGSSHDLKNMCPGGEGMLDERQQEHSWTNTQCSNAVLKDNKDSPPDQKPSFPARPEMKTITIKATYREDIIRFRLSLEAGIDILKQEVAKRLKLEIGTFEIKYLDDDHEWVLIACDADLLECVDISRSSSRNVIRLLVHDMMANLGSSCESSGE
ncbi:hypothetical protein Leryth_005631 [Lithospermum erythrorhizon]|nr:hypothetical protein Leryth_005631 [Lithospermum erythrorhizon]